MLIRKIVKTYFVLAMASLVLFAAPHLKSKQDFMTNVLGIGMNEETPDESPDIESDPAPGFEFKILNDSTLIYASPGSNRKPIMNFSIKSSEHDLELKELKLKIVGVDPLAIEKAVLIKGEEALLRASRKTEYLLFRNINLDIQKGTEETFSVAISLNGGIAVGERVRLEIETPNDVFLLTDGFIADLSAYKFPMQSPYLTVIQKKPKFKVIYK